MLSEQVLLFVMDRIETKWVVPTLAVMARIAVDLRNSLVLPNDPTHEPDPDAGFQ